MKIIKIESSSFNQSQVREIKKIIKNTVLKKNCQILDRIHLFKSFDFPEFKDNKNYFLDIVTEIVERTYVEYFEFEVKYEEDGRLKQQIILFEENKLFLADGLYDYGFFCPTCFEPARVLDILGDYKCPYCNDDISKCFFMDDFTNDNDGIRRITYFCFNRGSSYPNFHELICSKIKEDPEKTIICPECGQEYKLKDIESSVFFSEKLIKDYNN